MRKFDDSAQLLLLAAFAIGFTLVISTIMLNNIIYASNMASESTSDLGNYEISNIAQMTDEATRAAYDHDNKTLSDEYMDSYTTELSRLYASRGYSVSFENSSLSNSYFTENGLSNGNSDWIVVKNVNHTDYFAIDLTNTSKLGNASNAFEVHAINQSGTSIWFMKIYNDTTQINISVNNNTLGELPDPYMMNITGNAINNGDTFGFNFPPTNESYMVKFVNSSNALGIYTITGQLADGSDFDLKRRKVINATMTIASTTNKLNVSIPVTVP
ncbi:hypothetical protein [Methanococcoides methylutens]|uniref:Uncharacterized protein n=1 Tax=Methanococcoides methylutens MM1 TaxID=1434104 RepID=A0A0E3SSX8_METMT|nr:hypothetical protein [Methanococcoides methylutens]AKB85753.1 hypothetical protein MCMEM_1700 [Methanococcoides methylutens MM1]